MTRNDIKVGLFLTSSESVRRDGISRDDSGAARILPVHREPTLGVQLNLSRLLDHYFRPTKYLWPNSKIFLALLQAVQQMLWQ